MITHREHGAKTVRTNSAELSNNSLHSPFGVREFLVHIPVVNLLCVIFVELLLAYLVLVVWYLCLDRCNVMFSGSLCILGGGCS